MQIIKSIFLAIILMLCLSFSTDDEKINWDFKRPLTWADFTGEIISNTPFKAVTVSEISVDINVVNDSVKFNISNSFLKNSSWTKERESAYLLKHEQNHFNITEVFARKLRKALATSGPYKLKSLQNDVSKIRNKIYEDSKDFQKKYDQETKHSEDKDMQKKWEKVITYQLSSQEDWAPSAISAKVKK